MPEDTSGVRPVLIVGLQKSGTSVLFRLLQDTGIAFNPFRGEGDAFWGNTPPFAPDAFPAGTLYQRHGGAAGHSLSADDATEDVRGVLRQRLAAAWNQGAPLVNKNPYNSVRIPWLRAVFPSAVIVAVVRAAVPTAWSLAKKYVPHEERGEPPDAGWWGVKPAGWRELLGEDKLLQSAHQWAAVTSRLVDDIADVDMIVDYPRVCAEPARVLTELCELATGRPPPAPLAVPPLRCFDDEYRRGSRLRSKNRYYRERGSLNVPTSEPVELSPLTEDRVAAIEAVTERVEVRLREVCQPAR